MKTCPYCSSLLSDDTLTCPYCNAKLDDGASNPNPEARSAGAPSDPYGQNAGTYGQNNSYPKGNYQQPGYPQGN